MRISILVLASLLVASPVAAEGGGGGGGGGEGGGTGIMGPGAALPVPTAPRDPSTGSTVTRAVGRASITLSGPIGNRDMTVKTAEGRTFTGKHVSIKYNLRYNFGSPKLTRIEFENERVFWLDRTGALYAW